METPLLLVDWSRAAASLVDRGWARLEDAIPAQLAHDLLHADKPPWYPFPPDEGVVRQAGFGSFMAATDAAPVVRDVGGLITDGLVAGAPSSMYQLPPFNEVQWSRYPEGDGYITAHRDPTQCGGVVAVATLSGSATFRVWSEGSSESSEWLTRPGDVVLLRGGGWPDGLDGRPRHEAESPVGGDRHILTFRHNCKGAGAPYEYS